MDSITEKNSRSYNTSGQQWAVHIRTDAGHRYLEKPAMEKELPSILQGKSVLSIGVGSGYELDEILNKNPSKVVGIDISEVLLKIASEKYPNVEFQKMDMMDMSFPDKSFDLVYSSLTFHYANNWDTLLAGIHRVIRKNGTLLFSTHHPTYWSQKPKTGNTFTNNRGVTLIEHSARLPAGQVDIIFYNHPSEQSIIDSLEHAGFHVQSVVAPLVVELTENQIAVLNEAEREAYNNLKRKNQQTPLFLVVRAIAV